MRVRLCASASAHISSHWATVMAMGFSTKTCLPARSAFMESS